jgi:hypothetical protein
VGMVNNINYNFPDSVSELPVFATRCINNCVEEICHLNHESMKGNGKKQK